MKQERGKDGEKKREARQKARERERESSWSNFYGRASGLRECASKKEEHPPSDKKKDTRGSDGCICTRKREQRGSFVLGVLQGASKMPRTQAATNIISFASIVWPSPSSSLVRTRTPYNRRLPPPTHALSVLVKSVPPDETVSAVFFTFRQHPECPVFRLLPIKLLRLPRRVRTRKGHPYTHGARLLVSVGAWRRDGRGVATKLGVQDAENRKCVRVDTYL